MVQTDVGLFIVKRLPIPTFSATRAGFLTHSALRLTCNHAGYAPLWTEQLGDVWKEEEDIPRQSWPVLREDDTRWAVRAAIDAVVADAYGLDRSQYEHVLSTFSHKSYPKAPELCLAAFDELRDLGLEAFTRKHDPYWDIPLNESLPQPVIDLPIPGEERATPERPEVHVDRNEQIRLFQDAGPLFTDRAPAPPSPPARPPAASRPAWMERTPVDRQVLILARVVDVHQRANRLQTLGNVKAEKIIHLVEAHAGIDVERAPVRDAAGPVDFERLMMVARRAEWLRAFSVRERPGRAGGIWSPGPALSRAVREYEELFAGDRHRIERILHLLVPLDSDEAEIVATLYSCWNDLLARGSQPTDGAIIQDFHGWSEGKKRFKVDQLSKALAWMRERNLVPTGKAALTVRRSDEAAAAVEPELPGISNDDPAYAIIAALLESRGMITSTDAQAATSQDAASVRPHLQRLVQEGRAVTEGQRRGMKYRRVDG